MVNVLNKFPKHLQAKAKSARHQIWMASTREHAGQAFEAFLTTYTPKYPKAAECLAKDKKALLAFYDFPSEHWHHIRTTNQIESTFATMRLRTAKTRGCVSRTSILSMVFKLARSAEGHWVKLCGAAQRAKLMHGVPFKNGVEVQKESRQEIAA
jgi:transposase-like protein